MRRCATFLGLLIAIGLICPGGAHGQQVTGQQVTAAVEKAIRYLRQQQGFDGRWPDFALLEGGTTSIATLALLNAGVPVNDPAMQRALRVVSNIPLEATYVVS